MSTPALPEELLALIFEKLALSPATLDRNGVGAHHSVSRHKQRKQAEARTLARRERISALRNICLAAKPLHRLAWPILYRNYCNREFVEEDDDEEPGTDVSDGQEYSASKFLRTICLKPYYGLALRSMTICGWTPVEALDGLELFELLQGDATVSALFQWRARGFWLEAEGDPELVERLHRTLSLGLEDGLLTMLLLMCPNIKELDLTPSLDFGQSTFAALLGIACDKKSLANPLPEPDHDFEQEEADYVIAQMFGTPWPEQKLSRPLVLQRLESLTIRSPGVVNFSPSHFRALLTLPSLRTLQADGFRGNMGFPYTTGETLRRHGTSPKLQSLTLSHCQAESKEIIEMVEMCPELRELSVVWDDFHMTAMSDDNLDERWCLKYGDIVKALVDHTPNLKMLELNASAGWPNHDAAPKHPFVVGDSLDGLHNLVDLRLDDHAIYGSQYGTFGSSLGSSVPKGVASLTLYSEEPFDRRGLPVTEAWLRHQDDDLGVFLQDQTFDRLSSMHVEGREREILIMVTPESKHGWQAIMPPSSKKKYQEKPLTLVNTERLGDLGRKLLSRALPHYHHTDHALSYASSSSSSSSEEEDEEVRHGLENHPGIIDLVSDASDEA